MSALVFAHPEVLDCRGEYDGNKGRGLGICVDMFKKETTQHASRSTPPRTFIDSCLNNCTRLKLHGWAHVLLCKLAVHCLI